MKSEEITALAREYAEEIYPNLSDKIISLRTHEIKNAERLIRFLLRRYCLVEKDKVREEYEGNYRQYLAAGNARPLRQQYFFGRCFAVMSLFPDIAKEVEE